MVCSVESSPNSYSRHRYVHYPHFTDEKNQASKLVQSQVNRVGFKSITYLTSSGSWLYALCLHSPLPRVDFFCHQCLHKCPAPINQSFVPIGPGQVYSKAPGWYHQRYGGILCISLGLNLQQIIRGFWFSVNVGK